MAELDPNAYVNLHEIGTRARLADVSEFYQHEFEKRAAGDIEALINAFEIFAAEAVDKISDAEKEAEDEERERKEVEVELAEAKRQRDELVRRADNLVTELDSANARLRDAEAKLAEKEQRIAELAAQVEADGATRTQAPARRKRVEDPTIQIEFHVARAATKQRARSGR